MSINNKKLENGCYFVPLGGVEQIGMNFNLYGIIKDDHEEWIIMDAGVSLSREFGLQTQMASIKYAMEKKHLISGIICTHAHDDHVGAIPYILPRLGFDLPIYATSFTMEIVKHKLNEHKITNCDLRLVDVNVPFNVGNFGIHFLHVTHSIPESNMIVVDFQPFKYRALHTGDWKFDNDPISGPVTNKILISNVAKNVDVLLCDSTNSHEEEPTPSEGEANQSLSEIIGQLNAHKRVIVSCFSSNIARIKGLIDIARSHHRKVVLLGRSLMRMYENALDKGYVEDYPVVTIETLHQYVSEKMLVICTGSQAEPGAVLQRLADGKMNNFSVQKDDAIIFSSRVIPGNEIPITKMKNILIRKGVRIIDSKHGLVHVSGHPSRPEIVDLIDLCNPRACVPVHGDPIHLLGIKDLVDSLDRNIQVVIPHNGALIKLDAKKEHTRDRHIKILGTVQNGKEYVDGNRLITENCTQLFEERKILSENGCFFIALFGRTVHFSSVGILERRFYPEEISELLDLIKDIIENNTNIIGALKRKVSNYFYHKFKKTPFIQINILHNKKHTHKKSEILETTQNLDDPNY